MEGGGNSLCQKNRLIPRHPPGQSTRHLDQTILTTLPTLWPDVVFELHPELCSTRFGQGVIWPMFLDGGPARTVAGLLCGAEAAAQGQGDGGASVCPDQSAAGAGGGRPSAGDMAGALRHREPSALGEGRGLRGGPGPGANPVGAATAGGAAEPSDRNAAPLRSEKHIGGPSPLQPETLGDPHPHRPTLQ